MKHSSMEFRRAFSGAPWEEKAAYCRALRAGDHVVIGGTVAFADDGGVFAPDDLYAQTRRVFDIIDRALAEVGVDRSRIIRTRMFTTDISRWEEVARAHRELFAEHPPTTTLVEVKALIAPGLLIEIEVEAIAPPEP